MPRTHTMKKNRTAKFLSELAQEKELEIANTGSRNEGEGNVHNGPLWKQTSSGLYPSQKEVEEQHMNCEAYSTFSSVGSDHRVVSLHISLSFRGPQSQALQRNLNMTGKH